MDLTIRPSVLEEASSGQREQTSASTREHPVADFARDHLGAFAPEAEPHEIALHLHVGLQKGGCPAGSAFTRVGIAAGPQRCFRDEVDDRGGDLSAIALGRSQASANGATDGGKRLGETLQLPGLEALSNPKPVGMVSVLEPTGGILPECLQVHRRVGRVADVGIGRRHGE